MNGMTKWMLGVAGAMVFGSVSVDADAFCGFYVAGAEAELYNDATTVVMMRQPPRTVLSMQNTYRGPVEDFALVVPVPVVLQEENVKTLSNETFDHIERLSAPRLVEYWEQDPCAGIARLGRAARGLRFNVDVKKTEKEKGRPQVRIEAQFEVGEYEIVILSADDSTALEGWLKDHDYSIPDGAEPLLRPYVQDGSKFFVAKVDVEKVRFEEGRAQLSPLRFHYDSDDFRLPVRLGLMNSQGTQDLLVHVLGRERYQAANYANVTIPTNIDVTPKTKAHFGAFYASLFDRTLQKLPKAVVTEYAWSASSCDPCPAPPLSPSEVNILGGDVIEGMKARNLVLTRLHLRYDAASLGEDLVLETAQPIAGGRERMRTGVKLETDSAVSPYNSFQARYAIRHPWEGPIECAHPIRGRWGPPPDGKADPEGPPEVARETAFADRDAVKLADAVRHDVPAIDLKATNPEVSHPGKPPSTPAPSASAPVQPAKYQPPRRAGCTCEVDGSSDEPTGSWAWLLAGLAALGRRRHTAKARSAQAGPMGQAGPPARDEI